MLKKPPAVSLIELLMAIVLLTIVTLAIGHIQVFSRFHVTTSDRRAQVQNEASLALEHIATHISRAVGNTALSPAVRLSADLRTLTARIDSNANGIGDPADQAIQYSLLSTLPHEDSVGYRAVGAAGFEEISRHVARSAAAPFGVQFFGFDPDGWLRSNTFDVQITTRWIGDQPASADNPEVTLRTTIFLPQVSTN